MVSRKRLCLRVLINPYVKEGVLRARRGAVRSIKGLCSGGAGIPRTQSQVGSAVEASEMVT
jgi:hypothetical protein